MLNKNICFNRNYMNKILGEQTTSKMFEFSEMYNNLKLSSYEASLLIPLVLSCPSKFDYLFRNL